MTDDDLLAEYLGAPTEEERADAARQLAARGIDADDFEFAFDELGAESAWLEPSSDLEDRIMAEVLADLSADRPTGAPTELAPAAATVTSLAAHRARREARRVPRLLTRVAAVAAALAIGVVIGRVRSSDRSFDSQAALAATPLAPRAAATVKARTEDAGVRIELSSTGLPDPPAGSIYEAWVTNGIIRIPIGTFSKGGKVVLWSGVPLDRYPDITVTLEPEDGNPASSGQVVLRGRASTR
jgi:Anti-sigma-K factor rskA